MKFTDVFRQRIARKISALIDQGETSFDDLNEFKPKLQKMVKSGLLASFEILRSNEWSTDGLPSIIYTTCKEAGGKTIYVKIKNW